VKRVIVVAMAVALGGTATQILAENSSETPAQQAAYIASHVCFSCHGPGGANDNPMFPILAAQQPSYIENQLEAFRAHKRAEPTAQHFMWGVASRDIDAKLIAAMAHYFYEQPPAKGIPGDANLVTEGQALFHMGDPTQGLPACASCHGQEAKGNGPFPRLAGQHKDYLIKQLHLIKDAIRNAPVMHGVAVKLNDQQMDAVATYLQSLD
jgi:cytochrome c553